MSHMSLPVAVFGATGAQGGPVVRALLDAGRPVRVIVRDPARAAALAERGAEVVVADLTDATALRQALMGVVGAFAHLPFIPVTEIIEAQARTLGAALVAAEVPLTVFTLSGPLAIAPTGVVSFDSKAAAYRILRASGAPLVVFTPLGYLANLSAPFTAPSVVAADELRYPLPASHRQAWISVEDQARLAIAALDRPDLAGRTFAVGALLTGSELAAGIGEGLGRPIRYVPLTPRAFADDVIVPMMGPQVADALARDYGYLSDGGAGIELEPDTAEIVRELSISYTGVAAWARSQDWEGSAAYAAAMTK